MKKKLDSKELEDLTQVQNKNELLNDLDCDTKYEEILDNTKIYGSSDIDALNLELEQIKSEFNRALKRLDEIDYDFIDTIDKNDYELLQKNYENLTLLHGTLKGDLNNIENELELSKREYDEVLNECDSCRINLETYKRSSTPRPEWRNCGKIIDSGGNTWEKISLNKSSDNLVDLLINEFLGTYSKSSEEYVNLDSLPSIDPVPNYFLVSLTELDKSFESNKVIIVKNRRLNRRELGLCIKELWDAKLVKHFENSTKLNTNELNEKMTDFVFSYFLEKFNSLDLAIEWTVNLKDSCARFFRFEKAAFFLNVLNQTKDEEIMIHLHSVLHQLSVILTEASDYEDLKSMLIKIFPLNNLDQINVLIELFKKEFKDRKISLKDLFDDDDKGRLGSFISCLIDQSKLCYIAKILNNIKMNSDKISIYEFVECIKKIDPQITEDDLKKYCDWIFDKRSKFYLIDKDEFSAKLHNGNFFQH
jgi:hypothetical protein